MIDSERSFAELLAAALAGEPVAARCAERQAWLAASIARLAAGSPEGERLASELASLGGGAPVASLGEQSPARPADPALHPPGDAVAATIARMMVGREAAALDATAGVDALRAARPALPFTDPRARR